MGDAFVRRDFRREREQERIERSVGLSPDERREIGPDDPSPRPPEVSLEEAAFAALQPCRGDDERIVMGDRPVAWLVRQAGCGFRPHPRYAADGSGVVARPGERVWLFGE